MPEVFCDILPEPTGWIFIVNGTPSPTYPNDRLAMEAARSHARHQRLGRVILRKQDLLGRMMKVAVEDHVAH
ncbi:hypothetical protein [Rhizobium paknamense]|uniref:DUF2188 domain-containing protein n=1 Tax=Rhizobium paknamense TaxID=1206817 RepID=A0ABU0IDR8_9HYPH|nr:hypothetical protein [Rhizobium paknamense]MDQ0455585.1 hypothetical protein [Rhizobium paknamense]